LSNTSFEECHDINRPKSARRHQARDHFSVSILLVATMIYLQITGGAEFSHRQRNAARQQSVAQNAAEAKASVRGMQIGVRDIILSPTLSIAESRWITSQTGKG